MTDTSSNLSLPYLLASQTQKHVTYNELVNKIDALLMLCLASKSMNTLPLLPIEGQCFIIAPNGINDWDGKAGNIAIFQNLGWEYVVPQKGFIAYIIDENKTYIYNGAWVNISETINQNENFNKFAIGTSSDVANPFSAKLNNALFCAKYVSDNGDGNLRIKINKESTAKTASFLFQNNWAGRVEFGLCDNDNFSIKLSADGNAWSSPLVIDNVTLRCNVFGINFNAEAAGRNELLRAGSSQLLHL